MEDKTREITTTDGLVQMLYYLSEMMNLMVSKVDMRIRQETGGKAHLNREIKRDFKGMQDALKRFCYYSDKIDTHAYEETGADLAYIHDSRLEGANEFVRVMLLYYDRCGMNEERANAVVDFIRQMPTSGIFPNDYVKQFRMK